MTLVECIAVADAWRSATFQVGLFCFVVGYLYGRFRPAIVTYLRSKGIGKPLEKEQ